jgi:hypothetical protein
MISLVFIFLITSLCDDEDDDDTDNDDDYDSGIVKSVGSKPIFIDDIYFSILDLNIIDFSFCTLFFNIPPLR